MTDAASARLQTERKNWRKDHPAGFTAKPAMKRDGSANILEWECVIPGKEGSAWAGGEYKVKLNFPQDYPLSPPIATFTQNLFHPNIFEGGQVCLSILKAQKDWAASITLKEILLGLQDLLTTPNPDDPANGKAAQMYKRSPADYLKKAKETALRCKPKDDEVVGE